MRSVIGVLKAHDTLFTQDVAFVAMAGHPPTPGTPAFLLAGPKSAPDLPDFERGESFVDTVRKLCL